MFKFIIMLYLSINLSTAHAQRTDSDQVSMIPAPLTRIQCYKDTLFEMYRIFGVKREMTSFKDDSTDDRFNEAMNRAVLRFGEVARIWDQLNPYDYNFGFDVQKLYIVRDPIHILGRVKGKTTRSSKAVYYFDRIENEIAFTAAIHVVFGIRSSNENLNYAAVSDALVRGKFQEKMKADVNCAGIW